MIANKMHTGISVKSLVISIPFFGDVLSLLLLGIEDKKTLGVKLVVQGEIVQTDRF